MKYNLSDILDIDNLQSVMEKFTEMTGNGTGIIDLEGNVLVASGWQDICTKFHRVHPETLQRCTESDVALASRLKKGEKYNVYQCLNGMVDVAVPLIIGGKHLGNLFIGQFLFEPPDKAFFRRQALKYGFNEDAYLEALAKVSILSKDQVKKIMGFLSDLASFIGETGLTLVKNKEWAEENRQLREELDKKKKRGGKFLMFTLGGQAYGINILKVREIIPLRSATPIPEAPEYVKGVIDLRGKVVPVLDLGILMDVTGTESNERSCIIIAENQGKLIGLIADKVSEVTQIMGEDIEAVKENTVDIWLNTGYIYGMVKSERDISLLIHVENIFAQENL
jgi:chemotaxis signal transduction protein/ligand-binding sensor protein